MPRSRRRRTSRARTRAGKPWVGGVISFSSLECKQEGADIQRVYIGQGSDIDKAGEVSVPSGAENHPCLVAVGECNGHTFVCHGKEAIEQLGQFMIDAVKPKV